MLGGLFVKPREREEQNYTVRRFSIRALTSNTLGKPLPLFVAKSAETDEQPKHGYEFVYNVKILLFYCFIVFVCLCQGL